MSVKTTVITDRERALGAQVRRARLLSDTDQATLAARANISVGALQNLELGKGARLTTLVRVLRALDRDSWLDTLEPEPEPGPIDRLRGITKVDSPKRASRRPKE